MISFALTKKGTMKSTTTCPKYSTVYQVKTNHTNTSFQSKKLENKIYRINHNETSITYPNMIGIKEIQTPMAY